MRILIPILTNKSALDVCKGNLCSHCSYYIANFEEAGKDLLDMALNWDGEQRKWIPSVAFMDGYSVGWADI